jgi:hypothetical protein
MSTPIVYHGASLGGYLKALQAAKIRTICVSYFACSGRGWGEALAGDYKHRVLLDSGAFSWMNALLKKHQSRKDAEKAVDAYIAKYAAWCVEQRKHLDHYITFDYLPEAKLTWDICIKLKKRYGLDAMPVYHGDVSTDVLRRYKEEMGHDWICISKRNYWSDQVQLRRYYDGVFNMTEKLRMRCHGLACTGRTLLDYPWYSVDSTLVIKATSKMELLYLSEQTCRPTIVRARVRGVESAKQRISLLNGYNIDDIVADPYVRFQYNAEVFQKFMGLVYARSAKSKPMLKRTLF